MALLLALALLATSSDEGVLVTSSIGDLHGFPSMSDDSGRVIADGELQQERKGDRLFVAAHWVFRDGREVHETDEFHLTNQLVQARFSWTERTRGEERRRFEVDFETGIARAVTSAGDKTQRAEEHLDLPPGRAFAGYGTALAVNQLPLADVGSTAEITIVAFTPKPRTVTLAIRRDGEEQVRVAGRAIPCDRFTLHPKIPFPINLLAHAQDAHLWFTHGPPRGFMRGRQNLATKDDPMVIIDVVPRGPASERRQARGTRAP